MADLSKWSYMNCMKESQTKGLEETLGEAAATFLGFSVKVKDSRGFSARGDSCLKWCVVRSDIVFIICRCSLIPFTNWKEQRSHLITGGCHRASCLMDEPTLLARGNDNGAERSDLDDDCMGVLTVLSLLGETTVFYLILLIIDRVIGWLEILIAPTAGHTSCPPDSEISTQVLREH